MTKQDIDSFLYPYNVPLNLDHVMIVKNYNMNQLEVDHPRELVDYLIMMDKYHDYLFDDQIEMYYNSIDHFLFDLMDNLQYDDDEI